MDPTTITVSVPDSKLRSALGDVPSDVRVIDWDMRSAPPLDAIDIVVPPYMGSPDLLQQLQGVKTKLVQSQSIGFDGVATALPEGHRFANAASVHETATAELALALALAAQRGLADFVRSSIAGKWASGFYAGLADRSVLLIGYGGVGRAIERRLLPFETEVVRVSYTARADESGQIFGFDSIPALLPDAEIVIVAVQYTPETRGLVDGPFLATMKDGSLLINVARGKVADTDALLKEAKSGRLRLALDVTDPEPLPEGHELFSLDNVFISPHVGGNSGAMLPRMARLLRKQIDRMRDGEEPINVVLTK